MLSSYPPHNHYIINVMLDFSNVKAQSIYSPHIKVCLLIKRFLFFTFVNTNAIITFITTYTVITTSTIIIETITVIVVSNNVAFNSI